MLVWRIKRCKDGVLFGPCYSSRTKATKGLVFMITRYFFTRKLDYRVQWYDTTAQEVKKTGKYFNRYYDLAWKVIEYDYEGKVRSMPWKADWTDEVDLMQDKKLYEIKLKGGKIGRGIYDKDDGLLYDDYECYDIDDVTKFKEVKCLETTC